MKITVLTENTAGRNCLAEFGLSYLIDADKKVLFDTGNSDVFMQNAERLKVSLNDVDAVVLSHGHWDHGNGLKFFGNKPLLTHPDSFQKRYNKKDNRYVGLDQTYEELLVNYKVITSREPYEISPEIIFLGEIPRINDFEASHTHFTLEDGKDDYVIDDSGLVVMTSNGLVVITGCAHSGVCNMVEYACKVAGNDKVLAVMGGFHLKADNEVTHKTIEYLKAKGVDRIYPAHCTSFPALAAFNREFKFFQVLTGDFFYF
jgi:7,8-dihydropterin-6-yl-methyl-4-(beta-D-ribofuranosyl)aminobenzene 5'-phosphate synthase